MDYDENFLSLFNEYYPFERYIIKDPKPLNCLFDDVLLTEIFVPYTEIKPIMYNGSFIDYTSINKDDVYVKIKGKAGEMRFGYFDFNDHIRDEIREIVFGDIGEFALEGLYVDEEEGVPVNKEDLIEMLNIQKRLIEEKYGACEKKKACRDNLL